MKVIRDAISRQMLAPALRLAREQMKFISDPLHLREAAARIDTLGTPDPEATLTRVTAGQAEADWVTLKGVPEDAPVLLYLHGGAFVAETPVFHAALLARLCRAAGTRGLMLHYRLAPEHRYPAALDDCVAAYRWLLDQGDEPGRILVAGDSAGGNLTLALLLRARDEGLPLPAGAVAMSPVADLSFSGESIQRNDGVDDMFSADLMGALPPVYLSQPQLATHPHVSPVFGDYRGLPPLLLIVGSTELLLDDSVRVAHRCPSAQLLVWHGMPHVFPGFDFLPEAREATERMGRFMRDCVQGEIKAAAPGRAHGHAAAPPPLPAPPPARAPAEPGAPIASGVYLALAAAGALLTLALVATGLAPLQLWLNPALWAVAAVVAVFLVAESAALGRVRLASGLAATALLGPACGLALLLYWRSRRVR